jgi:hypothetical protein
MSGWPLARKWSALRQRTQGVLPPARDPFGFDIGHPEDTEVRGDVQGAVSGNDLEALDVAEGTGDPSADSSPMGCFHGDGGDGGGHEHEHEAERAGQAEGGHCGGAGHALNATPRVRPASASARPRW